MKRMDATKKSRHKKKRKLSTRLVIELLGPGVLSVLVVPDRKDPLDERTMTME